MFKTGCPHSQGKIMAENYIGNEHLITPWVLNEIDEIAAKSRVIIEEDSEANEMLAYFATIKDFNNNVEVIRCFAKYFEKILLLETNKYPEYQKYVTKKSGLNQDSSQSLAQLLGIAYTDICYLLILHIKEGYSLGKVKGLILKNMLHGNAELSQSPSGIIQSQMEEGNSLSEESVITKKIKLGSTQKVKVHDYGEPSCPFLLSNEVDNWIDDTIQFLLTKFLPKLLKQVNS